MNLMNLPSGASPTPASRPPCVRSRRLTRGMLTASHTQAVSYPPAVQRLVLHPEQAAAAQADRWLRMCVASDEARTIEIAPRTAAVFVQLR